MTAAPPLLLMPAGAVPVGEVVHLLVDGDGGRVFVRGELSFVWDAGDEVARRLAAVQLVRIEAARAVDVAEAFATTTVTLWRWRKELAAGGVAGLAVEKKGPKGPSKLTAGVVADIRARRGAGGSLRAIGAAVGVSVRSVRRALAEDAAPVETVTDEATPAGGRDGDGQDDGDAVVADAQAESVPALPVLAAPVRRSGERAAARAGLLAQAAPVFTPAARVPLAGLFLALPALEGTGLLACAKDTFGCLPDGFYGLGTTLLEWVLRSLAGEPRAEGATRVDPIDLGRVLGMDRSPEVKTIRRKLAYLAGAGKGADLLAGMAAHHLAAGAAEDEASPFLLYVDGHVRAYHGGRKVAKTHVARTRFPAPATVETWVADAYGDPVLVVMAQPGASLAGELRRLLPDLRAAVGHERRVLVGFDRGGWSPTLFAHMHAHGFDVLTWRKGPAPDVAAQEFTDVTHLGDDGITHTWTLADTMVDLPLREDAKDTAGTLRMRQVTRLDEKKGDTRQVHVLTTRTDLSPGEVIYRMSARWRLENYFRYARAHFNLDSHDSYTAGDDDPDRSVPNPAKAHTRQGVANARATLERATARTETALLALRSPAPGTDGVIITNAMLGALTAELHQAQAELSAAQETNNATPTRLPLGQVNPGQQVLDTETKLITHAIGIASHNTATALARDIRINTGYARAADEAHTLVRQILTHTGDIHPDGQTLTIRLDPLPTARATKAAAELCQHLTATHTRYPGTDMTMRYEVKNRP